MNILEHLQLQLNEFLGALIHEGSSHSSNLALLLNFF